MVTISVKETEGETIYDCAMIKSATVDSYRQHLAPGQVSYEKFQRTHLERNAYSTSCHSCNSVRELFQPTSMLCNIPILRTAS
jgi:hypothetical protein